MLNSKSLLLFSAFLLLTFSSLSYAKAEFNNINNFVDKHINDLLQETVAPVNTLPNLNINIKTDNQTDITDKLSSKDNSIKPMLHAEKTYLDIVPINNSNNKYLVTAIVDQTYSIPTKTVSSTMRASNEENKIITYSDVKMSYSAIYEHFKYNNADCYKVSKYKGGYISKSDPQMTCSEIKFFHKAFGLFYASPNNFVGENLTYQPSIKRVSSPSRGSIYSYTLNQPGFVSTPPGYSVGRLHFTIERLNSSFKKSNYISINFGQIYNPYQ